MEAHQLLVEPEAHFYWKNYGLSLKGCKSN